MIGTHLNEEQVEAKEEALACFNHLPCSLSIIWELLWKLFTQSGQARIVQGVDSVLDSPHSLLCSR